MKHDNLSEVVIQVFFFPIYYMRYVYVTIKNLTIDLKNTPTKQDFTYHFIQAFIGLLTMNFFILVFRELDVFKLNYNIIINNIYIIFFYFQNFSIFFIFSTILTLFLVFKNFSCTYITSIFLFSIKLFNVFFPILFLVFLYIMQFTIVDEIFMDLNKLSIEKLPPAMQNGVYLFVLIAFSIFLILIFNTRQILIDNYEIKNAIIIRLFFSKFLPVIPMVAIILSGIFNMSIFAKIPHISFEKLIHVDNLCIEKINYSLYKSNKFDGCEMSFEEYQKTMKKCQQIDVETKLP